MIPVCSSVGRVEFFSRHEEKITFQFLSIFRYLPFKRYTYLIAGTVAASHSLFRDVAASARETTGEAGIIAKSE
jgi:hypothetical protein